MKQTSRKPDFVKGKEIGWKGTTAKEVTFSTGVHGYN